MILEERDLGFRATPETRQIVEAAFTQALDRFDESVVLVRVRLLQTPLGEMECRARLFPLKGHTLVARASAVSVTDAVHATAHTLARLLVRHLGTPSRSRRVGRGHARSRHGGTGKLARDPQAA